MAVFVCKVCGAEKECRCKPQKCSQCGASGTIEKKS
ncbi:MAG: rubredoxin [Calditrichaeota bacterium]|nr:rubredoxin [Calditrichota bacterium]